MTLVLAGQASSPAGDGGGVALAPGLIVLGLVVGGVLWLRSRWRPGRPPSKRRWWQYSATRDKPLDKRGAAFAALLVAGAGFDLALAFEGVPPLVLALLVAGATVLATAKGLQGLVVAGISGVGLLAGFVAIGAPGPCRTPLDDADVLAIGLVVLVMAVGLAGGVLLQRGVLTPGYSGHLLSTGAGLCAVLVLAAQYEALDAAELPGNRGWATFGLVLCLLVAVLAAAAPLFAAAALGLGASIGAVLVPLLASGCVDAGSLFAAVIGLVIGVVVGATVVPRAAQAD